MTLFLVDLDKIISNIMYVSSSPSIFGVLFWLCHEEDRRTSLISYVAAGDCTKCGVHHVTSKLRVERDSATVYTSRSLLE